MRPAFFPSGLEIRPIFQETPDRASSRPQDLRDRSDVEFPNTALPIEHWRDEQLLRLDSALLPPGATAESATNHRRTPQKKLKHALCDTSWPFAR